MAAPPACTQAAQAGPLAATTVQKTGYAGFGSFHSDDVEVLIRQDAASYHPPPLPFVDPAAAGSSTTLDGSWGADARRHFLIDFKSWTFVNHGAFGGVSRTAHRCGQLWREHCEAQPLNFIDRELFPQLVRVIRELAGFVNCRPQDLVLLPNATTGLNAISSSMSCLLTPDDAVFSLDIGYGSVKKMLRAACDASGAQMVTAQVTFPISGPQDIISLVSSSLPSNTKLAVFDAVTSNTALVLPVLELVQLCRDRGVPVLIDGAHALGMLPINLQELQPDFYVSNCHKWLCGARGSAMLYVAPQWQQHVQPPVLSHGAEAGFLSRFIWDGCRDYAPLLAISSAIKWWRGLEDTMPTPSAGTDAGADAGHAKAGDLSCAGSHSQQPQQQQQEQTPTPSCMDELVACCDPSILAHRGDGGAAARCYMYRLVRQAAGWLAAQWGSECLGPPSMTGAMTLVRLPQGGVLPAAGHATSADAKYVQDMLHSHHIEVPIKTIQDTLYVRISAHIYNTLQDYQVLADAVLALKQQQPPQQAVG